MSSRRAVFAVLLAVVAGLTGGTVSAASVAAQEGCGSGGGLTGTVRIDSPADGSVVSGVVEVRGTASAGLPLGEISRVDVTLGRITRSESYPGASPLNFSVSIDTSTMAPGEKDLIVVACGTSLAGVLARGVAEIAVEVEPSRAGTSTSVAQPTTSAPTQGGSGAAGSATTTSIGSSAAAAAVAAGGTTTTSGPTSTAAQSEARAPAAARPEPVRPRAGPDAPLVLTETPDRRSSGPPLWVGAVVGISGGLGLLFSAASWRRRTHAPIEAEPVDPDLVEVR